MSIVSPEFKVGVSVVGTYKICNIYNITPFHPIFDRLVEEYKNHIIQVWILMLHPDFESLSLYCTNNLYYPFCVGNSDNDCYMIFRIQKLQYNPIDKFLTYYDNFYLGKNLLILNHLVIQNLKDMLHHPNEFSGVLKYNPILVNSNFSWKYVDRVDDTFKLGESDSSEIIYEKITYHTHPISTYTIKRVRVAWPSMEDYLGVNNIYRKKKMVIYHIVVTREGLYFIICRGDISDKIIKQRLNISYNLENIDKFLHMSNSVSDKIKTLFYDWNNTGIFII